MREILEFPLLTVRRPRAIIPIALLLVLVLSCGCSIKHTVRTAVMPGAGQFKTASFEEILDSLRRYEKINTLSCNELRVTLTLTGKRDSGQLVEYQKAPGYMLLKRPESSRLVVQMPVAKTTLFDLLSVGDDLEVWSPRENKLYLGKNSSKEFIIKDSHSKEFRIPIRGSHIFEAIFPQSVRADAPGTRISVIEDTDAQMKYYLLEVFREGVAPRIYVLRRIWIERIGLSIARQEVFTDEGQVASDIVYSSETSVGGFLLPQRIRIDRPLDAYSLDMEFKNWRVNPDLPEEAFVMPQHPGAETIHLN